MTRQQAIKNATRLYRLTGEDYFVVYEPDENGPYHVASDSDLDTWFQGISDNNVVFATADFQ